MILFKRSLFVLIAGFFLEGDLGVARDFSDQGMTFDIQEESFLTMIQRRVQNAQETGKLEDFENKVKKRVRHTILHPAAIPHIHHAQENRSFYYDPTLTVDSDIKDHRGVLIHYKGKRVNPLETFSWGSPMVFIDGDDQDQVAWALSEQEKHSGKIILVKGSPIELSREISAQRSEENSVRFYFDQGGKITTQFGIKAVPAKISQEGLKLLVEEIQLNPNKQ